MRFVVDPHDRADKRIHVRDTQMDFNFYVDYDDVWHEEVDAVLEWVVATLNEHAGEQALRAKEQAVQQ